MSVVWVVVAPVVIPLVQVAFVADGVGVQARQGIGHLADGFVFITHNAGSLECVDEQLAYNGHIGSAAIAGHAVVAFVCDVFVFGRSAGSGNQFVCVVGIGNKPVQTESGWPVY